MPGFVDIHSHLLPGIDDGPADLDGSLEMAAAAVVAGTSMLVATPHLRSDFPGVRVQEIAGRLGRVREALTAAGIPLQVEHAAEVSLVWALEAPEEAFRMASFGGRGNDLLLETPGDASMLESLIFQVRARGVRVTLAHPERSLEFQRDPSRVERLWEQGVLLQVNAGSLAEGRGGRAKLAERLCRDGLAHALASDGHTAGPRRPVGLLAEGHARLVRIVGEARATWMAVDVPAAIVAGERLPDAPEILPVRRSLFRRR